MPAAALPIDAGKRFVFVIYQRSRAMTPFPLFFDVLLYFVSIGALLVLFGSVLAIFVWVLLKLRRLVIQMLGGSVEE
jgi:hypothetical protein